MTFWTQTQSEVVWGKYQAEKNLRRNKCHERRQCLHRSLRLLQGGSRESDHRVTCGGGPCRTSALAVGPDLSESGRDEDSERSDEGKGVLHFAEQELSSLLFIGRELYASVPIESTPDRRPTIAVTSLGGDCQ